MANDRYKPTSVERRQFLAVAGTVALAQVGELGFPLTAHASGQCMDAIEGVAGQPWTRKHDNPSFPVVLRAPKTLYPKDLRELICICASRTPSEKIRAAGSHWALSEAAISDNIFVETHDPNNLHQAMDKTLYDVVPGCLNSVFVQELASQNITPFDTRASSAGRNQGPYPIHIETGKRIYQLYSELDFGDHHPKSLANMLQKNLGQCQFSRTMGIPNTRWCRRADRVRCTDDRYSRGRLPHATYRRRRNGTSSCR